LNGIVKTVSRSVRATSNPSQAINSSLTLSNYKSSVACILSKSSDGFWRRRTLL